MRPVRLKGRWLPSSVVRRAQESTLRRVDVIEIDSPSGLTPTEASRRFWNEHISEIKKARRNDNANTVIEEGWLDPGRPYLHYSDPGACVPVFETLVQCPTHTILYRAGVTFHPPRVASASRSPLFAAASLERQRRTTLDVLGSYHAQPTLGEFDPEWFHTRRGTRDRERERRRSRPETTSARSLARDPPTSLEAAVPRPR